jgi:hypothetical protein
MNEIFSTHRRYKKLKILVLQHNENNIEVDFIETDE